MPIIRSSRLHLCHCRIWCVMPWLLVVGWWEQSSRLCVRGEGNCATAGSSVHYTTSCKHSLVLLRMGEIIARNMLSWSRLLINIFFVESSWLFILLYQWCTVTQTSNPYFLVKISVSATCSVLYSLAVCVFNTIHFSAETTGRSL